MPINTKDQIFIIVSDPQVSYLLERVIRSAGYTVTVAKDIQTAQKMLSRAYPALTVVSEKLSDGNGLEFAAALSEKFPTMPTLLFAPQETPELLRKAMHAGVVECLIPPLHSDDILKAVEACLQQTLHRKDWVLIESKRATATLQQRVDELEALSQVGRSITASLDLDSVLSAVVDAAVTLTNAEEGSLLLVDETSGELYMRAARNFQEDFVRTFRLPIQDSLAGSVIRTGQPVLMDEKTPQKIKTSYLVQSLIYVPLQSHGQIFGVLGVDNRHSNRPFTEHHVKVISAMADYAVIAIENARLYSHTAIEKNKLETILTQIQDGVIVIDDDGRLVMVNQTIRQTFNLGDAALSGKMATDIFDQPTLLELINDRAKKYSNRAEIVIDEGLVFSAQLTPIPGVGIVITMHDITYLKKLDRIKSDFVSTVSHDLRSPLTAILGYTELIERVGPVKESQHEFIVRVQMSVQNITALVNDLLNLGRIEAGFDSRKEVVHLEQIIQFALDGFKKRIAEHNQQLLTVIPPNLPPILGNPVHLRQMLDNLVENAVKYTLPGGMIQVNLHQEGKQLVLQVTDTGLGIPAIDLPYIFDKFYRASNAATNVSGTGLGLSIVKSIVENHQGRIWVESTVDQGTTFTVVLPVIEQ
ncbi:MAG: ATP-binding protein [Anaerolineaceae bacterium]